jgi:hypothetical protein
MVFLLDGPRLGPRRLVFVGSASGLPAVGAIPHGNQIEGDHGRDDEDDLEHVTITHLLTGYGQIVSGVL